MKNKKSDTVDIYELLMSDDEYFAVSLLINARDKYDWVSPFSEYLFFKCDQLEGVMKLFRDTKLIS